VRQLFQLVQSEAFTDSVENRFQHFVRRIWPRLREERGSGVLIFASSYFDFVRLRNFLKSQAASFAVYCEYTDGSNVLRARTRFMKEERRILLYTERAHFYFRPTIRCGDESLDLWACDVQSGITCAESI
jgi:U3 small nucleolar RNA-associated protein 25